MPALTNKSVEAVTTATVVYLKKFAQIKTEKKSLEKLKEQLAIYTQNTKRGEDFAEILDLLDRKVNLYLKSDDVENLIANL
jgi:4-hydroxy-3-methylbut-2-enyl diphosphate reductase IspH